MGLFRRKEPPQPPPANPPQVVVQVQQPQPAQPPVHVRPYRRRIPLLERPRDADARYSLKMKRLRRKYGKSDEPEDERAREMEDLADALERGRKAAREVDDK